MAEKHDEFQNGEIRKSGYKSNLAAQKQNYRKIYKQTTMAEEDVNCGFGGFSPSWLQILASKKTFVIVYALAGMQQFTVASYYIGTMSTLEKNYKMSSRQSGIISGAWDIGSLFANIGITYVASRGHRTRWVAMGVFVVGVSCFLRASPYLLFGPGENIKMYTKEYGYLANNSIEMTPINGNFTGIKKLGTNVNCGLESENTGTITFYLMVVSQIIMGVGTAVYWTCGATYLDDNARKNIVPTLISIVQVIRLFGPTLGFLLSSYALQFYVDPNLTPDITINDPRWIGAWWLGWCPIGISCFLLAGLLILFPRSLPRAAARRKSLKMPTSKVKTLSIHDFKASIQRITSNKIVIYNTFSSVCFTIGLMAQWTFMPKYLESQFRLSPSRSNFLTGTVGILCNALGILVAGVIISKFKPPPRLMAGWTVFVELMEVVGYASYTFMSCEEQKYHGHWDTGHNWNLSESCNMNFGCGNDIQFAPVCDPSTGLTFYSPCHAGCSSSSIVNHTVEYNGCACVSGLGRVVEGLCPTDCSYNILLFMVVMGFLSLASATGRTANTLLQFRCVDEEDKSLSIGVTETALALLGYMPAPLLYGIIMDWSCIVWGDNCGKTGNCWIYDGLRLRFAFNITAAAFLLGGTFLDGFVWYYSKDLKIYDEDYDHEMKTVKNQQKNQLEMNDTFVN